MDAIEALLTRRSIRRYTADPVGGDDLREVIRAGTAAPTAGDQRPWHFVVLDDRGVLDAIPDFHPHAKMLRQAPAAILVCADPRLETHKGYWVQDCAAAVENMLLAAHALGLGAVWLGVHPRPAREAGLRALLGIPDEVVPFAIVSLGHPAERKRREDRLDPARVHRNRW